MHLYVSFLPSSVKGKSLRRDLMSGVKKKKGIRRRKKKSLPSVAPTVSKKEDALNLGADEFIATQGLVPDAHPHPAVLKVNYAKKKKFWVYGDT